VWGGRLSYTPLPAHPPRLKLHLPTPRKRRRAVFLFNLCRWSRDNLRPPKKKKKKEKKEKGLLALESFGFFFLSETRLLSEAEPCNKCPRPPPPPLIATCGSKKKKKKILRAQLQTNPNSLKQAKSIRPKGQRPPMLGGGGDANSVEGKDLPPPPGLANHTMRRVLFLFFFILSPDPAKQSWW
jgi:hypothetical protein